MDWKQEIARTKPDYTVYVPKAEDGSEFDSGNEHFLVFPGPDGNLMCVWTQSTHEGAGDHRIMFSQSADDGTTWAPPIRLAGPEGPGKGYMASWGFPLVSETGRIYVVWNQYHGIDDVLHQFTGTMDAIYSDDAGKTWSGPQTIPMKRSPHDHPDPTVPSNWIVWQLPIKDLQGKWFTGFSRWLSTAVRTPPHRKPGTAWEWESVVEFMRFENIDDDPQPRDIQISFSAWGDEALRVPHYDNPLLSVAHEPSIVRLPNDHLFCVMRTMTGYVWYSASEDDGQTWCSPRPLLRKDHGVPILQPICCCPIYQMADERYLLFHHNNNGRVDGCEPENTRVNRRPAFIAVGEYRSEAEQPVWFSDSKLFMDNDNVPLGPQKRIECAVYSSFTVRTGRGSGPSPEHVFWHPDRKFFLVGKKVTPEFLQDLTVPRG